MSEPKTIQCYEYVERPYAEIHERLRDHAYDVFQLATISAAKRATSLTATLSVGTGGLAVGVDVNVLIDDVREEEPIAGLGPLTVVELGWEAAHASALFPRMVADICVRPISPTETQIELKGEYRPPLGIVGGAIDDAIGHRIAEASVHRFLHDVAEQLRQIPQDRPESVAGQGEERARA